ncbi:uncharacterized protein LOC134240146 [Saccostrea cucullata]|uniref:uncharacterized protein LOC134240146 n=1 Tax=Saccostrea cuccullata TaxID=36930 RepID=UPI002ED33E0B
MTENQFNKLQPGELCPFNSNDWETMKNKQNCQDPEFYHCMPNQYNEPGEICVKPNWASKNYCPIFNTVANDIDLIPCDLQYGACPDTDFRSNKVYLYPGCLNNTLIIGKTSTDRTDSESTVLFSVELHIIIPAVTIPLLLLLIIGVACYCWRRKGTMSDGNDIELQRLLHQNTVPWRFKKTINYLENKVFCRPECYEDAVGFLSTKGHITLIGPPGSGKTSMAVQLARQLCGKKELSQLKFCETLHELTALPETGNTFLYIIMDDWIDRYMYYPSKFKEDTKLFDHIFEDCLKNKRIRIIFTVQDDRWNAYRDLLSDQKLFCQDSLFFIKNKSFSKEVLQHMIKNHLQYHETKEVSMNTRTKSDEEKLAKERRNQRNEIKHAVAKDVKSDEDFSLPVIIDLICANRFLVPGKTIFFRDEFSKILRTFLHNWLTCISKDDKNSFCILMFAALQGGKVKLGDFTSKVIRPIYENVCKEYGSECLKDIERIEVLLWQNEGLKGCLYQENDLFVFCHDSLLCFVLKFLTETTNANFLIRIADIEILLKRCWIKESIVKIYEDSAKGLMPNDPVGTVIIPIDAIKDLAKRIHEDMSKGYSIPDWSQHVFMEHKTFSTMWREVLTESVIARPDPLQKILPVGDESQIELSDKSRLTNITEESTQNIEKDAQSNAGRKDHSLIRSEKECKQGKHKEKKIKEKIPTGKKESNSQKRDSKEGETQSNIEQSPQINLSPDSIEVNLPGNDFNPNEHAENSKQLERKKKKKKVSLDKKQTNSKKVGLEKNNEETTQRSQISVDSTPGDTPV